MADARFVGRPGGRHAQVGNPNDGEAGFRTSAQYRALGRVPVTAPDDHRVVFKVLGGRHDQILGDDQPRDRAASGRHLDDGPGGLLDGVSELRREG